MAAHIPQETFAALAEMLQEFLSSPVVVGYIENAHDPVASAEFQVMADQLMAAFENAGIEVLLPQMYAAEEAVEEAEEEPAVAALQEPDDGLENPLDDGFVDDHSDGFDLDAINCDLSTVYMEDNDVDELYEEAMVGHGLPGALINVVHDTRPLLAFVRAQDDLPNFVQNEFYFDLRRAIYTLMRTRQDIPTWRTFTDQALANLIPYLDADVHGLVIDLMEQIEQAMEVAANWMFQNLLPDNTVDGFPLVHQYYVFYVRRHLRHPPIEDEYDDLYFGEEVDNQEDNIPLLMPEPQPEPQFA
jgi:hypothetical protein